MPLSVQDILSKIKHAERCEACGKLLLPTPNGFWTCMCDQGRLRKVMSEHGQKIALLHAKEVTPDSFSVVEREYAYIAGLPWVRIENHAVRLAGGNVARKARKWTKKAALSEKKEVVALDGTSSMPSVWIWEVL